MNHSVSNIEFEWSGMESVEGANISIEPKAGSVGTFGSADVATAYVHTDSLHSLFVHLIVLASSHPNSIEFYFTLLRRALLTFCVSLC